MLLALVKPHSRALGDESRGRDSRDLKSSGVNLTLSQRLPPGFFLFLLAARTAIDINRARQLERADVRALCRSQFLNISERSQVRVVSEEPRNGRAAENFRCMKCRA